MRFRHLCRAVLAGALGLSLCAALAPAIRADSRTAEIARLVEQHALVQPAPKALRAFARSNPDGEGIRVFVRSFDPYASFLTGPELRQAAAQPTADFAGIGMDIVHGQKNAIVCIPYPDSTAYKAGLAYGDILLEVDGHPAGDTLEGAAACICGQEGSTVTLRVRGAGGTTRTVTALRGQSAYPTVATQATINSLPCIRIYRFGPNTARELETLLAHTPAVSGIILDLRGNTGGDLAAALDCLRLFMPDGAILVHCETAGKRMHVRAKKRGRYAGMFLHIWQDRLTASAAEVFLAAARAVDNAVSIGQTSAGKAQA